MRPIITLIAALALVAAACGGDVGDAGPLTTLPTTLPTTQPPASTSVPTTPPGTDTTVAPTTPPSDPSGAPVEQQFVAVFLVTERLTARPVIRAVDMPAVAGNAVRELIAGPTPEEQDTGLHSAVPTDTLLLGLSIENGLATIDLSREFEVGGGSTNILSRLAQVVYTLTQFDTIDRVRFYLDGEPAYVFSGEGVLLDKPVGRADYASILPIEPGPDTTAAEPWSQGDLPDISKFDPEMLSRVALVADDDVLNVRQDPGVTAPIVGMLEPGVVVARTGQEAFVGPTRWVQVETPVGGFWVSDHFLAAEVAATDFADDTAVATLLDELAATIRTDGDLRSVTSRRGLYVAHHADPVRFSPDDLATILTDPTAYHWPSNAVGPEDIEEIPPRTFAAAIADSFVGAYSDDDAVLTRNEPNAGGNGRLPEHAIPFELTSFNYVGVHDPGDNPEFAGLDWITWYVSIDYENGAPVVVGLTVDMWSP